MTASTIEQLRAEIESLREALGKARQKEMLLESILQHSPLLISTKDLNGVVTLANAQFRVLDGPPPEAFIGKSVFELFPADIAEALWHNDRLAAEANRPVYAEETVTHRDKTLHTYYTVKFPVRDGQGNTTGTCAVSCDITDLKQALSDSLTDELTGTGNRRLLGMRYEEEQSRARRQGEVLNAVMADIDNFKRFNDIYGHAKGDEALVAVARALRRTLSRPGDLIFRVGGEEFLVLYPTPDAATGLKMAEDMRREVEHLSIPHEGNLPYGHVTVSVGVAALQKGGSASLQDIYQQADSALYRAKNNGKNTVSV